MKKVDLAEEYVRKYIEIGIKNRTSYSKRFIATVMHAEHPDMFKDVEDARSVIRVVTGANSRIKRKGSEQLAAEFAMLEQPTIECDIKPYDVPKQYKKALIINDIHGKFHDRKALEIAINYGVKQSCDICIINGDLFDFYGYSKFDKNNKIIQEFFTEREWVQDFLLLLQKTFNKVIFKKGNHDIRRERYIQRLDNKIPELSDLTNIKDYIFFDGSTVDIVEDYNYIKFGKLNLIHGHENYGSKSIHIAYKQLFNTMTNVMSGHYHITQSDFKRSLTGEIYGSWVVGCLCSLYPRYHPQGNNWNSGFAIVEKENNGNFEVNNKMIIDGKIY